ncbi:MAG: ABC transporter substrate-binding protein [Sphaerochaeta sp.]|jgi:peptide/nickel transport system substrate-binding protein|uniref:ABC transporter substrate-binding protein n=1 Tax=Sphaerochaeta sp. TaxID=1972642 RepID=UPI003D09AEB4
MKKTLTLLLALLCSAALFAGGAQEGVPQAGSGYKDTITVGQGADVTSFDPHIGKETPAVAVTNHIFDTLVDTDPVTGEVVPQIAEKWEVLSPVSYRFHIRKGLKFHNGEDLTADDVKFSLDRAIASASVSYIVDFIKEVKIEDDYTVLVTTKAPYGPTLRNLAVPFAAIVPKDYVTANPDALKTKPVGSGPYKFVSWAQNDSVQLEAYDDYYAGAPETKKLVFKVIPEASQRTIALETGELDIAYDILVSDLKRVKENKNLSLFEAPSLTCFYISFNMRKAPFDNQKVRQAINMAIDRQLLVDTVNSGTGAPADEIIAPAVFGYYSTGVWEYNPQKAKALLAEAGYPNGFECSLWVNNNQSRVEMCQAIQEMLREIGIKVKVEVMEFGTFISRSTAGEHDMGYFGWVTSTKDADYTYYSLEHSSQQGAPGNRSFIADAEVDRLVELGRTSADTAVRLDAYKNLALRLKELANNAPIIYTAITAGANKKVEGFVLDPIGYHRLETVKVSK